MKTKYFLSALLLSLTLIGCRTETENNTPNPDNTDTTAVKPAIITPDPIVFSFAFNGCNRVGWEVNKRNNPSMANHIPLDSVFSDMQRQLPKPSLFFNLGDIVRAEQTTTTDLNDQLAAWVKLNEVTNFVANSGIEMIAVPGNHELLQSVEVSPNNFHEYPLPGSTAIWSTYMSNFMPASRNTAPSNKGWENQFTFSFIKSNIGFVVMNTDTFNPSATGQTYGLEGQIPLSWITQEIANLQSNPTVDHIFVLGHRPYYVYSHKHQEFRANTGHGGLPEGKALWTAMNNAGVTALLSAHTHDYQRFQPNGKGVTQVIAGNAGSPGQSKFFGYSIIDIYKSGKVELRSRGYCVDIANYTGPALSKMSLRDHTILDTAGNSQPLIYPYTACNN